MIERISLFFVWIKCNSNLFVDSMMTTCHHISIEYGKYEGPDNVKSYILMCTFLSLLKATSKGVLKVKSLTIHFIFTMEKERGNGWRRNKLIHLLWLFAVVKASLFIFLNRYFLFKCNFVGKSHLSRGPIENIVICLLKRLVFWSEFTSDVAFHHKSST